MTSRSARTLAFVLALSAAGVMVASRSEGAPAASPNMARMVCGWGVEAKYQESLKRKPTTLGAKVGSALFGSAVSSAQVAAAWGERERGMARCRQL